MTDTKAMYQNWASDKEVTKFLTWPCHSSIQVSENILTGWISQYENKAYYQWAIELKEIGEPVGSIGQKWWRQGITSEALNALIAFFFREAGVNRIEARHDPKNPSSGKVMMKCGIKYEGTMRKADLNNQGLCDYSMYSILADDYFGAAKGSL